MKFSIGYFFACLSLGASAWLAYADRSSWTWFLVVSFLAFLTAAGGEQRTRRLYDRS